MRQLTLVSFMMLATLSNGLAAQQRLPRFSFQEASAHKLEPRRAKFRLAGVPEGFNTLWLVLTVSPEGDVLAARTALPDGPLLQFWTPAVEKEVLSWKYRPFLVNGTAVKALVDASVNFLPLEKVPSRHITPPVLKPDSKVSISLEAGGCGWTCTHYTLTVSTEGISFEGEGEIAVQGPQTATVDSAEVRKLAKRFIDADFYSMDAAYNANFTDLLTTVLGISIDGQEKKVGDYGGTIVGMPEVISELQRAVFQFADANRWVGGKSARSETAK